VIVRFERRRTCSQKVLLAPGLQLCRSSGGARKSAPCVFTHGARSLLYDSNPRVSIVGDLRLFGKLNLVLTVETPLVFCAIWTALSTSACDWAVPLNARPPVGIGIDLDFQPLTVGS